MYSITENLRDMKAAERNIQHTGSEICGLRLNLGTNFTNKTNKDYCEGPTLCKFSRDSLFQHPFRAVIFW